MSRVAQSTTLSAYAKVCGGVTRRVVVPVDLNVSPNAIQHAQHVFNMYLRRATEPAVTSHNGG